jgi:hypothetical protein
MTGAAQLGVQLTRVGLALGALAGMSLVYAAGVMVLANRSYHGPSEVHHRREKWGYLLAGVLLVACFVVSLIGTFTR